MLTGLLSHWTSLSTADILTAAYLVLLIVFVVVCNLLFESFVDSKPEGRKTVLGTQGRGSKKVDIFMTFPLGEVGGASSINFLFNFLFV